MDNIENRVWAHRRALRAPLRPPFGHRREAADWAPVECRREAARRTEAGVEPQGPGGAAQCDFLILLMEFNAGLETV